MHAYSFCYNAQFVIVLILIAQNLFAPDQDPKMTVEYYERSVEQNELLGLNDMKTEDY